MSAPTNDVDRRSEQPAVRRATSRAGVQFALAAALVSGVSVYLNGKAVRNFSSPTVYTTAKNLFAGVILVAIAIVWAGRTGQRNGEHVDRGRTPIAVAAFATIAVIGGAVPFVLFFEGLSRASSANAAFSTTPRCVCVAPCADVTASPPASPVPASSRPSPPHQKL